MTIGERARLPNHEFSGSHTTLGTLLDGLCFQNGIYKHSDEYGTGTPILRITDFDNHGRLTTNSFSRVALSSQERDQYVVRENDIIINRVNSLSHIGKSMLVPSMHEYPVFESNMMRIRISEESPLASEYVAAVLQAGPARRHFRKVAKPAVAQASINQDDVRAVALVLHPKPVQRRIAKALLTWDLALEKTEQLIAAKERRHAWLLKRLINHHTARRRWNTVTLGELILERSERSAQHDEYPVLTSSRRGLFLQSEYFSKQVTSEDNTGYKIMRRGDFTFRSMSDDGRFVFNRLEKLEAGIISPAYGVFHANGVNPEFLAHLLNSAYFSQLLARETQGGTRKALRLSALREMEVDLPTQADQERIAAILGESLLEIDLLSQSAAALKTQKRGLMQKLLTGQWRLPVPKEA